MASNVVVKVTVEELTKYGYKANGKFVNYSKQLSDSDKAQVVPGAIFEAEYYIADSGKEYLNKIVARTPHVEAPKAKVSSVVKNKNSSADVVPQLSTCTETFKTEQMTRADWERKDTRISRQGLFQAAIQALTGVYPSVDDLAEAAMQLADKGLEYVNRV